MPEGPEVNVIKDGLNRELKGSIITKIEIPEKSKFVKKSPDGYNDFVSSLPLKIKEIKSKGKLLYFECDGGWIILCRLLMSGGWYLKPHPKHNHLIVEYQVPGSEKKTDKIYFVDPRHFGTLKFTTSNSDLSKELNKIGPDLLLDKNITKDNYISTMKQNKYKTWEITKILMDQSIFSGIGNYLKSEILYACKISPHTLMKNLSDLQLGQLFDVSRKKIKESYLAGGASVRNYSDIKGKDGTFSWEFKVYNQKKDPLGNLVKKEKTKDGRMTHWVPNVQV